MLEEVAGSNLSVQLRKGGKFSPTLKPGETRAEFEARTNAPKEKSKAPKPPFARVEKAAQGFAKRIFKKAMNEAELYAALDLEGVTGKFEETFADENGGELLVTVARLGGDWEVQWFVPTRTIRGQRWKFGAARLRSIQLISEDDAAAAWLDAA